MDSKRTRRRLNVWYCVLINQLAFPGMGTVMAGKRAGYPQAIIMVAGFALVMAFMLWFFTCTARFLAGAPWTEEEYAAQYRPYSWMWKAGLVLCAVSWFWSLVSSLALLAQAKGQAAGGMSPEPKRSAPPPLPPGSHSARNS